MIAIVIFDYASYCRLLDGFASLAVIHSFAAVRMLVVGSHELVDRDVSRHALNRGMFRSTRPRGGRLFRGPFFPMASVTGFGRRQLFAPSIANKDTAFGYVGYHPKVTPLRAQDKSLGAVNGVSVGCLRFDAISWAMASSFLCRGAANPLRMVARSATKAPEEA